MTSVNTQAQARTTSVQAPQQTNDRPTVSEYVRDTIASLMRSGAKDDRSCENLAVRTLAELCHLTPSQAWRQWIQYAATVTPA